jgi:signal transduction histidine kinase
VHVLVDAVPLARNGDRPIALVVIHDITGLRKTERERTEFFEMASHEIKTPLTVLVGSVELALRFIRRGENDRLDEILSRADEGGRRLTDLVRDLLDLTRLDAGKLEIRRETMDLVAAVLAVVDETRLGLERHELGFAAPMGAVFVNADPRRIAQIVHNLLDNAVRYSPDGGLIDVSIKREGPDAIVRITDRGVGVPEEEQAHLFQRFYRTTRTRSFGGTGLGLFISRRIAEAHGGRLWLERSGPGGTTFALALPVVRAGS